MVGAVGAGTIWRTVALTVLLAGSASTVRADGAVMVVGKVSQRDRDVIVEVDSDRGVGAPMTIVTAHLLTAGAEDESFASRDCAMCNEDALKRTVGDLSRDLLQRAAARSGRTKLAIRSTPDRSQIVLDGKPAGATDARAGRF